MTGSLPFLDREQLSKLLPMSDAIAALGKAFAGGIPQMPARTVHSTNEGQLLMMPAWSSVGTGVKLITYNPTNTSRDVPTIQGVYVLFGPDTSTPVALFDGSAVTEIRTAAVSGVATGLLAPADASRVAIFGTGIQGRSHLRAMQSIRPIQTVLVASAKRSNAESFARDVVNSGTDARVIEQNEVLDADIVCLCTTSSTPVISLDQLPADVHINAIGSFQPHTREVGTDIVTASAVYVESRAAAMDEAGDLIIPESEGDWNRDSIAGDLHQLATASVPLGLGRTLFKGVGLAYEDLIVASAALERLRGL